MDSIFDCMKKPYKIVKPIRLIELFAGIGSQAMALRDLGKYFEHYKVIEFDRFAIASYNAIHGTNFSAIDITTIKGSDLEIKDTNKYDYIMTYSFPCQDLSVAGKKKGMVKGSGTRSGLLWEVERLLNECNELPQILVMENVPQIHNRHNNRDFNNWISFLERKGYSNFYKDLNSRDFGIPQNRERCFMISILGDYKYIFPNGIELNQTIHNYLESNVDESYYVGSKQNDIYLKYLLFQTKELKDKNLIGVRQATKKGYINCKIGGIANLGYYKSKYRRGRVIKGGDIVPTLTTSPTEIAIIEDLHRIRNLTPLECWKLMGFTNEDFYKVSAIVSSHQLYKQIGNSIVKNVLMAIFNQFF